MAEHTSISTGRIEDTLDKTGSKFLLVTLAAKRARQLNSYQNGLGQAAGQIVPPQVSDTAHKPLGVAMREIAAGKIVAKEAPDETASASQAEDGLPDMGKGSAVDSTAASEDASWDRSIKEEMADLDIFS